jgi:hypothetical protein
MARIALILAASTASSALLLPSQAPRLPTLQSPSLRAAPQFASMSLRPTEEHGKQEEKASSQLLSTKLLLPVALAGAAILTPSAANAASFALAPVADTAWAQALSLIFVSEVRARFDCW